MKNLIKCVSAALVAVISLFLYSAASAKIEATPDRLARGKYLVTSVLDCASCHSQRQMNHYNWPPKDGMRLAGGIDFRGFEANAVSANLTPYGIGKWSDEEVLTAITTGKRPDGRVLDPVMPYKTYGKLELEELSAIIVYLRTLAPVVNGPFDVPRPAVFEAAAAAIGSIKRPGANATEAERGKYLMTLATCADCHGEDLSGGAEFPVPGWGTFRPQNLTPHESGIGSWSREQFIARFKSMESDSVRAPTIEPGDATLFMPWWIFSRMTEKDLGAIYAYLRTIPPVERSVTLFEPLPGEPANVNFGE